MTNIYDQLLVEYKPVNHQGAVLLLRDDPTDTLGYRFLFIKEVSDYNHINRKDGGRPIPYILPQKAGIL